jgi:ABC-type uncharacterized transport system permease subunit
MRPFLSVPSLDAFITLPFAAIAAALAGVWWGLL